LLPKCVFRFYVTRGAHLILKDKAAVAGHTALAGRQFPRQYNTTGTSPC
jgi:hypothetical protein